MLDDLSPPMLVVLAIAVAGLGIVTGVAIRRWVGWRPAAGLGLLIASPVIPYVPIAAGFSLDDILPILGLLFLAVDTDWGRLRHVRPDGPLMGLLLVGSVLLVVAGLVSSVANATGVNDLLAMLMRGPGRYVFLAAIAILAAVVDPPEQRQRFVALGLAGLGAAEAAFGLMAFFLPLGGIGLQPTRKFSVLYFEVPGRIAGTLGISPNFIGAIFLITIIVTVGLAIDARVGRHRLWLWIAALVQVMALTLTFTRASLGLMLVGVAVLLLVRGRIRFIVPVLLVVALGFATTPPRAIEPTTPGGDPGDPGTRPPVAVERLTSDVPDRVALWASALFLMVDHPITGVGPGRTREVAVANPDRYVKTPYGTAATTAHNTILLAGAEAGIVGALGAFLVNAMLSLAALRILVRGRRRDAPAIITAGAVAALTYLIQGMFNNLFSVAAPAIIFAVLVGAFVLGVVPVRARAAVDDDGPAGLEPGHDRGDGPRPVVADAVPSAVVDAGRSAT